MLRLLLTLIVANLLALFWWQGSLDSIVASGRDPDRLRQQVDADRLKVVPTERLKAINPPLAAVPGATANSVIAATAANALSTATGAGGERPALDPRTAICQELVPLEDAPLTRARVFFTENSRYFLHEIAALEDSPPLWLIVTLPSESLLAGQRKYADFKRQGFEDFSLLQDGPYRFGLSFGLFRSEQAAKRQFDQLERRGVRNLRIVSPRANGAGRAAIRYRFNSNEPLPPEVAASLASLLLELAVTPNNCNAASSKP